MSDSILDHLDVHATEDSVSVGIKVGNVHKPEPSSPDFGIGDAVKEWEEATTPVTAGEVLAAAANLALLSKPDPRPPVTFPIPDYPFTGETIDASGGAVTEEMFQDTMEEEKHKSGSPWEMAVDITSMVEGARLTPRIRLRANTTPLGAVGKFALGDYCLKDFEEKKLTSDSK